MRRAASAGGRRVAVNLSPAQVRGDDLPAVVADVLRRTGLPADRLELEVTEGLLIGDTDQALRALRGLKALGVRLAIDDFGTGYSSLSYLSRFPVDVLKVDRSFIAQLQQEASNERELTRTIVQLGESLEMVTVAEGVETDEQLKLLKLMKCDYGQGYLFGRPAPLAELLDLLGKPAGAPSFSSAGPTLAR